jgi:hypothetical protein
VKGRFLRVNIGLTQDLEQRAMNEEEFTVVLFLNIECLYHNKIVGTPNSEKT